MTNCIGHTEFGKPMGHQVVVIICEAQSLNLWTWTIYSRKDFGGSYGENDI